MPKREPVTIEDGRIIQDPPPAELRRKQIARERARLAEVKRESLNARGAPEIIVSACMQQLFDAGVDALRARARIAFSDVLSYLDQLP